MKNEEVRQEESREGREGFQIGNLRFQTTRMFLTASKFVVGSWTFVDGKRIYLLAGVRGVMSQ
jgi:hypothetical protein